ncbi:MAG: M20 family metallopeptidase [Saprospiraceae bacterium]|nr:M20 family metallopeptidase [Saprospiraceae bacterium]
MTTESMANKILRHLQHEKKKMEEYLHALVMEESPSRDPLAQDSVFQILEDQFTELDFHTIRMPGRNTGGYLYASDNNRIREQPLQLLLGHCDTVWPKGTLEKMPLDQNDNQLRGPGVYDMKAGLTQIIFALKTLETLDLKPDLSPVVLINSDEEIGSKESTCTIKRLAKISQRAYVLEPPLGLDGKLKTARKGLGRFTLTVRGLAAHAGLDPNKGANAIVELSHQIQQLFKMNDPAKGVSVNVGMIAGGVSPNVVAPESSAVIDVRVLNQVDGDRLTEQILKLKPSLPGTELKIEGGIGRPPMLRTTRNQALWHKSKSTGHLLGIQLEEGTAGGGSDGNTTSQYTATLDGLGTTGDGAHAPHEFIFLDKLIERTALLTLLIIQK